MIGKLDPLSLGDFYLTTMTREEKILKVIIENVSGYQMCNDNDPIKIAGTEQATSAISQLFDEEMIEFAEWMDIHATQISDKKWTFSHERYPKQPEPYTTAELLQIFKNRYSPDNQ